jgi:hypothetical protein
MDNHGRTILLPSMDADGNPLTMPQAMKYWQARGQSLGVFDTEANAHAYEAAMHDQLGQQYVRLGVIGRPAAPAGRPATTTSGRRVFRESGARDMTPSQVAGPGFPSLVSEAAAPTTRPTAPSAPDVLNPPSPWQTTVRPFLEARRTISGPQQLPGPALGPAPSPALQQPVTPPEGFIQAGISALQRGQPRPDPFPTVEGGPLGLGRFIPGTHQANVAARAQAIMPRWRHLSPTDRRRAAQWFGPAVTAWLDRNAP